ncbi:MAG TPA: hypothetical protein VJN96_21010 [Vicinamibacterales bacterium]|nr:hypothetical protein [Vicinamibacterales bacterium]
MDGYVGGSGGAGGSTLKGAALSVVFGGEDLWGERYRWLGLTLGDASFQFGGHNGKDLQQTTVQWGARCTLTSFMKPPANDTRVKIFVQGAGGFAYTNDGTDQSGSNGVGSIGGGMQVFWHKVPAPESTTARHYGGVGFQWQYDYIFRTGRPGYWRTSAGLVIRALHKEKH